MECWLCSILNVYWLATLLWNESLRNIIGHKKKDKKFWSQNGVSKFSMTLNRKASYNGPNKKDELVRIF